LVVETSVAVVLEVLGKTIKTQKTFHNEHNLYQRYT
jgi:hypothetical protein